MKNESFVSIIFQILAFCDLHGHSRKSNVFAYGCDGCDGTQADMRDYLNARVLPFIMSRTVRCRNRSTKRDKIIAFV